MSLEEIKREAMTKAHQLMLDGIVKVDDPNKYASVYAKLVDDIVKFMAREDITLSGEMSFRQKIVNVDIKM